MALIYEVKKTTLNFKKEKPVVYKVAAVRQQTVKYDALVKEVASSCGVHRTQTKAVVEGLLDRLVHYMDLGMPVRLEEFGTFKPAIQTKVKETAEEVDASNVVVVSFPCHSPLMSTFNKKIFSLEKGSQKVLSLFLAEARGALGQISGEYENKSPLDFSHARQGSVQLMQCYLITLIMTLRAALTRL